MVGINASKVLEKLAGEKKKMYKFPWTDGKSVGETCFWKNLKLYRPKYRFEDVFFTRIVIKAERIA